MAIVVPIVSEWNAQGVNKASADIKKAESGWGKVGSGLKSAFLPAVGVLGVVGLAAKSWISEAEGGRQASKRLEQVFRSMGDTTGKAAAQAEAYATALGNKIGVDDDDIKVTQAKLATFGAVSNELARQAGIFDRATAAAHDLAAAGFGDAASNAVQLGKALQDPTKGITALAKSGVTFTDQEKEKIKALQKSGDLLGAQQIVLKAVEHQVGGVAAATATSSQKMQASWANTQEALGTALLPAFDALSNVLQKVSGFVQDNSTVVLVFVGVLAGLAAAIVAANIAMSAYATVNAVFQLVTRQSTTSVWAFTASLLANPITWVVIGIVALIAALVLLWVKCEGFRKVVMTVWGAILGVFKAVFSWVRTNWPLLLVMLTGPIGAAALLIIRNWDKVKAALSVIWGWIRNAASTLWDGATKAVGAVAGAIRKAWDSVWSFISGIINKIKGAWDSIKGLLGHIPGLGGILGGKSIAPSTVAYTTAYPASVLTGGRAGTATVRGQQSSTVNVFGALDPEGVARQVRAILNASDIRHGRTTSLRRAVAW